MKLLDYTTESGFLPHIKCADLDDAVARLVSELATGGAVLDEEALKAVIMRRETEVSTAIGGGLVLPHARHRAVSSVCLAAATLTEPLDLPAADDQPVDVVIVLVGPDGDPRPMLRVLAKLARLVKSGDFLSRLRSAGTAPALRALFDV